MKPVMADLILYPQTNEDGSGYPDGETRNIDKRIKLVLPQTAQGKAKIDLEHRLTGFSKIHQNPGQTIMDLKSEYYYRHAGAGCPLLTQLLFILGAIAGLAQPLFLPDLYSFVFGFVIFIPGLHIK